MKAGRMSSQLTQLTNRTDNRVHTLILGGVFVSQLALGASDAELSACSAITDKHQRLECYDAAVQNPSGATKSPVVAISDNVDTSNSRSLAKPLDVTPLSKHWEVDPESKNGLWSFRAHKPNYFLLGRYTDKVNYQPYETYFRAVNDPNIGLDNRAPRKTSAPL